MKRTIIMVLIACFATLMGVQQAMAVRPQVTDTIVNTVTADYQDVTGTAMPQESDSVTITVLQVYSVDVTPVSDAKTGPNNGSVIYTVTVTNTGNGPDTFNLTNAHQPASAWNPAPVVFYSDAAATAGNEITDTGSLAADGGTIIVYAKIGIPGAIAAPDGTSSIDRLTATSQSDGTATDYDEATTTVGTVDMSASSKTADATNYQAGENVIYTITLDNTAGTLAATNVVVTDTIPANLTYIGNDAGGTFAGGVLTVNYGTLAAGASDTIQVTATVNGGVADATVVSNTASIAFDQDGGTPTDRSVDVTIDAPHLTVTKVADKASAAPGDTITYTITVTNDGHADATSVVISDTLSNFVTFGAILPGATNCAPTEAAGVISGNPTAGTIAQGASMSFQYTVTVNVI